MLYRATMPYAGICAGVVTDGARIVRAAPVFKWAVGKPIRNFQTWVLLKGGLCEVVP